MITCNISVSESDLIICEKRTGGGLNAITRVHIFQSLHQFYSSKVCRVCREVFIIEKTCKRIECAIRSSQNEAENR